jgi:uncharacterized BrkB/YihY/UPF0761 family membrane protein
MKHVTAIVYWALGTIAGAILLAVVTPVGNGLQQHLETRNAPRTGLLAWDTPALALVLLLAGMYGFIRGTFAAAMADRWTRAVAPTALLLIAGFVGVCASESVYRIFVTDQPLRESIVGLYLFD